MARQLSLLDFLEPEPGSSKNEPAPDEPWLRRPEPSDVARWLARPAGSRERLADLTLQIRRDLAALADPVTDESVRPFLEERIVLYREDARHLAGMISAES